MPFLLILFIENTSSVRYVTSMFFGNVMWLLCSALHVYVHITLARRHTHTARRLYGEWLFSIFCLLKWCALQRVRENSVFRYSWHARVSTTCTCAQHDEYTVWSWYACPTVSYTLAVMKWNGMYQELHIHLYIYIHPFLCSLATRVVCCMFTGELHSIYSSCSCTSAWDIFIMRLHNQPSNDTRDDLLWL